MANPEVEGSGKYDLPLPDDLADEIELDEEISEQAAGWRMEKNSNGYYRWRWQIKDEDGNPITYVNKSGKVGYKRGSRYVTKNRL